MTANIHDVMAVLDTILPGGEGFPSASEADLGRSLGEFPDLARVVDDALALSGGGFADRSQEERTAVLARIEAEYAAAFRALTTEAYAAYYTAPAVLAVISATTSYRHPPQPGGYVMPDFDESVLATVRNNPVSWRPTSPR